MYIVIYIMWMTIDTVHNIHDSLCKLIFDRTSAMKNVTKLVMVTKSWYKLIAA
jgi:hypothetical protein